MSELRFDGSHRDRRAADRRRTHRVPRLPETPPSGAGLRRCHAARGALGENNKQPDPPYGKRKRGSVEQPDVYCSLCSAGGVRFW
jgi:hypothetical protein